MYDFSHYKPTPTHYFIKLLEEKSLLQLCVSSTTDELEKAAGISDSKVVKAQGTHTQAECSKCFREVDFKEFRKHADNGTPMPCPHMALIEENPA